MAELKKVRLDQIEANPFRDLDDWPTLRDKVEELKASIESTGFWDGYMIVRKTPGQQDALRRQMYQQAFGHHRLVALRELYPGDHMITINLQKKSDDEMFSIMVGENSETYGQQFYYAVMQPIASLVKAYGEGKVKLEEPAPSTAKQHIREAPGQGAHPYTAYSVGQYLGWLRPGSKSGSMAADKVIIALSALELIEKGALSRDSIIGMNQSQVATEVKAVNLRMRSERADIDSTLSVKGDALAKAVKEDDTNKVNILTKEIESIEGRADAKVLKAGQSAAKEIAAIFNPPSPGDVFDAAAPKEVPTKAVKTATQAVYDYMAKVEGFMLDSHAVWSKVASASPKAQEELLQATLRLAERAKNRAKEIR